MANQLFFSLFFVLVMAGGQVLARRSAGTLIFSACKPSSHLNGKSRDVCNTEHDSDCCEAGRKYPQFHCSPPVTRITPARMIINSFAKAGDGGAPSRCDNQFHGDDEMVVALSTGWYDGGSRCLQSIRISSGNGRSVLAQVVDECDSVNGCDEDHDFQPPSANNIVHASPAVWKALSILDSDAGAFITWSDA